MPTLPGPLALLAALGLAVIFYLIVSGILRWLERPIGFRPKFRITQEDLDRAHAEVQTRLNRGRAGHFAHG